MQLPKMYVLLSVCLLLSLTACGGTATPVPTPTQPPETMPPLTTEQPLPTTEITLTGNPWVLVGYGDPAALTPALTEPISQLNFAPEGQVSASPGCNSLSGQYAVEGETIRFTELIMTLMACSDPQMQQETAVSKGLEGAERFEITGSRLTLFYEGGTKVLVYEAVTPQL